MTILKAIKFASIYIYAGQFSLVALMSVLHRRGINVETLKDARLWNPEDPSFQVDVALLVLIYQHRATIKPQAQPAAAMENTDPSHEQLEDELDNDLSW